MKKVLVCIGTRPNLIKITKLEECFDKYPDLEFRLLHTGQHYDYNMNEVFFEQLGIKRPDKIFNLEGKTQIQVLSEIMVKAEEYMIDYAPDLVLVPGDVNSTFACALAASRNGIKVAHLESGLRSFDRTMPEEINRIMTDDLADLFFVTEPSGVKHLKEEGKNEEAIKYVGNTMIDSLVKFEETFEASDILERLSVKPSEYITFTFHRPGNVDNQTNLSALVEVIESISKNRKVVFPIHPRTKKNLEKFGLSTLLDSNNIIFTDPLGYIDFMKLIKESKVVITDSGGIQEETTFQQVPCLTVRPNTERPVTVDEGTNTMMSLDKEAIIAKVEEVELGTYKKGAIPKHWDGSASDRIVECIHEYLVH